ncbi:MAG: lysophospholipid acyltransferase family protein [Endozoicomonas sp. (ex Botrylloides leachii)]|nr:lysophospholipid acyltransferase family protein [Endozoicomonas sp. (ex Botrylloides leachii)]
MENSPFRIPKVTNSGLLERFFEKLSGLKALENRYEQLGGGHYQGKDFFKLVLNDFSIDHAITAGSKSAIPSSGSAVIVTNHPTGIIDGIVLADMLMSIRDDVKVLANELLCRIPDFKDVFIGVDVLSKERKEKNKKAIFEAQQWVSEGHMLVIFPAGAVSRYDKQLRRIIDPTWQLTAAKIIRNTGAHVTPIFMEGRNSWVFQLCSFIHPTLRIMRLLRELINRQGCTVNFHIGVCQEPADLAEFTSDRVVTNYLRLNTYLLANQGEVTKKLFRYKRLKQPAVIAPSFPVNTLKNEIACLPASALLLKKGNMVVYCAKASLIPHILKEIARLREITYREVGAGTGNALYIDHYDQYYRHLFLWDAAKSELVGAYRIGEVDKIVCERGIDGIYTHSLFRYDHALLKQMGASLEIGRAFIKREYQKKLLPLQLLWKGVGAFIAANPHYKTLFGPVSINGDYDEVSRHLIASYLEANNSDQIFSALVQPRIPLRPQKNCFWRQEHLEGLNNIDKLSSLIKQIEHDKKGVPVLLRQYLKLQGVLAAFHVSPDFNNGVDGLMIVDLMQVNKTILGKYMGVDQADAYQKYHHVLIQ